MVTKKRGRGRPKGSKNKVKKHGTPPPTRQPSVRQLVDLALRSHDEMALTEVEFGLALVKTLGESYRMIEPDQDGNYSARKRSLNRAKVIEYLVSEIPVNPEDEDWTVWFNIKDHFFNIPRPDLPYQEHSDPSLVAVWAYGKGYVDLALKTGRPHIEGQVAFSCCRMLEKHCLKGDPDQKRFAERRIIDPDAMPLKYEWRINHVQEFEKWSEIAEKVQS